MVWLGAHLVNLHCDLGLGIFEDRNQSYFEYHKQTFLKETVSKNFAKSKWTTVIEWSEFLRLRILGTKFSWHEEVRLRRLMTSRLTLVPDFPSFVTRLSARCVRHLPTGVVDILELALLCVGNRHNSRDSTAMFGVQLGGDGCEVYIATYSGNVLKTNRSRYF